MTAHAGTVTKLLKRYNFNKESFRTNQLPTRVFIDLGDSIAYNHELSIRLVEILENHGYTVELSGRRMISLTKGEAA